MRGIQWEGGIEVDLSSVHMNTIMSKFKVRDGAGLLKFGSSLIRLEFKLNSRLKVTLE